MKPAVLRLLVPAVLFAAWIGYLGWLVAGRPLQAEGYPLVVSRPQVMASEADVVVELPERSEPGKIQHATLAEVLHDGTGTLKEGQKLDIAYLEACRPVARVGEPPHDWDGPGLYLVPLRRVRGMAGQWEVCPIPPSPGFHQFDARRIYRATPETRAQYARIAKP